MVALLIAASRDSRAIVRPILRAGRTNSGMSISDNSVTGITQHEPVEPHFRNDEADETPGENTEVGLSRSRRELREENRSFSGDA